MLTDSQFPSVDRVESLDSLNMEVWIVRLPKNPDPPAQFRLIVGLKTTQSPTVT